jgi:hypothetical protein
MVYKAIVMLAVAGLAGPALAADRAPDATERTAIEKSLRSLGYTSWEEIELDDDGPYWEIDDARKGNGPRFDVRLAPKTLKLIRARADD